MSNPELRRSTGGGDGSVSETDYQEYTDERRADRLDDPPEDDIYVENPFTVAGPGPPTEENLTTDPDPDAAENQTRNSAGGAESPIVDRGQPGVSDADVGGWWSWLPTRGGEDPDLPEPPDTSKEGLVDILIQKLIEALGLNDLPPWLDELAIGAVVLAFLGLLAIVFRPILEIVASIVGAVLGE